MLDVSAGLGVRDYRDVWDTMPEDQLQTWAAYFNMRRLEHDKLDYAIAQLSAIVANMMRDDKSPPARVSDMLIKFVTAEEEEELQRQRDMLFMKSLDAYI